MLIVDVALLLLAFVTALIGAGVLYVVARPVMSRLDQHVGHKAVAFVLVFALFFITVLPGARVFAELVAQVPDALRSVSGSAAVERLMAMKVGGERPLCCRHFLHNCGVASPMFTVQKKCDYQP